MVAKSCATLKFLRSVAVEARFNPGEDHCFRMISRNRGGVGIVFTGRDGSANKGFTAPLAVTRGIGVGDGEPSWAIVTALCSKDLNNAWGNKPVKVGWSGGRSSSSDRSKSHKTPSSWDDAWFETEETGESRALIERTFSCATSSCEVEAPDRTEAALPVDQNCEASDCCTAVEMIC